jgi:exodeoxyribonuclease VII small subunit
VTFEEDIARLEAIALELDSEGIPLDRALELFEEGVARLRRASSQLARAEAEVAMLVEQMDGSLSIRPLGDEGSSSGGDTGGVGVR